MIALVTGMIGGMEEWPLLEKVVELGKLNGKDIRIFDAVKDFTKDGKKPLELLLQTTDYVFELTREREYSKIGFEIQKNNLKDVIVRLPATVEWNRINRKFKDQRIIRDFIKPDLIVTLIDAEWMIQKKLQNPPVQDTFFRALKERNHTIYEILSWMNEEVSLSEDWAKAMNIPHYVIAVGEPPDCLYKLVTNPNPWVVYASYSMTYATADMRLEVNKVIEGLRKYAAVVDPQTVEIPTEGFDSELDKAVIYAYTVHRDLHWYVGKVHSVVAIHPYPERPPLSAGMMDELGHARDYMKRRYMIFPKGFSPFTADSYIEKGHLFETSNEFFDYIEKVEGRKPMPDILTLPSSKPPSKGATSKKGVPN